MSIPQGARVFGTRFWNFNPKVEPYVGFTHEGNRASLIAKSQPGDLIVILGTGQSPTPKAFQGNLIGLIEFERTAADAEDLLTEGADRSHLLDENGQLKWRFAVPAIRAWQIDRPVPIKEVIGRQLTMAATSGIDELSPDEAASVLALSWVEVDLGATRAKLRASRLGATRTSTLPAGASGQPGPPPSEWSQIVAREDGPTATYLMQFGSRDVWKIGISKNPADRCKALNFSIPEEILEECWRPVSLQRWPNGAAAYAMEQYVLKALVHRATKNERLVCQKAEIDEVWHRFLLGHD
jgi:hypothetical protein